MIQSFQGVSKRIASQQSTVGSTTIQHFSYSYDNVGNMISREDELHGLSETFTYDTLDRLTTAQLGTDAPTNYGFNSIGNMVEKSDVGTSYLYNLSKLHAVSDITPSSGLPAHTFAYDDNGNMDTFDGSPMTTWSSYNKPVSITTASASYSFDYGPDRARYRKVHNGLTTHYVGNGFEAINSMGLGFDTHRHYIRANGRVVMIREDINGTVQHRYVHTDHLGSVTALTELAANPVVERYSYDAWGLRRNPETWEPAAITSLEKRGYTGHEHLDDVGMIHMNGRVYSPSLGRMLSPDPVTQAPENAQNYNRYSYAYNNPLTYTDPSGFMSFSISAGWGEPVGGSRRRFRRQYIWMRLRRPPFFMSE
ncbi:RHS repeat domain-containing protein [Kineobactrum salinum]|uniref:RHS repeat-associated core domain-containing protein n=1 Tax=Kineobactrum salinum TaxID=2708301 RepID=A0A6C0U5P3_9GAMM|nr:RHS repeat-associated core domain-containing protein [Kineobactrum salinum]QIB64764.1 RHS repeat-associated core domain-containing protein [Kineobactrum salinum]